MTHAKKFTLSTLKSVLKNKTCWIKVKSSFDGMTDCVEEVKSGYRPIDREAIDFSNKHTFGIQGLWLVGSSRDYFRMLNEFEVEIYNSCGTSIINFS